MGSKKAQSSVEEMFDEVNREGDANFNVKPSDNFRLYSRSMERTMNSVMGINEHEHDVQFYAAALAAVLEGLGYDKRSAVIAGISIGESTSKTFFKEFFSKKSIDDQVAVFVTTLGAVDAMWQNKNKRKNMKAWFSKHHPNFPFDGL